MPKKLSISKALNRIRRIRVLTVVSSLAVVIALSQMILSSGVKSSKAATQQNIPSGNTYTIKLNGVTNGYIPAAAEGKDVIIKGPGTIYADSTSVWQSSGKKRVCADTIPVTFNGKSYMARSVSFNPESGMCSYVYTPDPSSKNYDYSYIHNWAPGYGKSVVRKKYLNGDTAPGGDTCPSTQDISGLPYTYVRNIGYGSLISSSTLEEWYTYLRCEYRYVYSEKTITVAAQNAITSVPGQNCTNVAYAYEYADCDTKRHFQSLVVRDAAIITHAAVTVDDMSQDTDSDYSLADETVGTARLKKVDFVVVGELSIGVATGLSTQYGVIDVTAKGYPATSDVGWTDANNTSGSRSDCGIHCGYGPGGGEVMYYGSTADAQGAGGGYGGAGTQGRDANIIGGGTYGDEDVSIFEFGSAGGNGHSGNKPNTLGGAGGGRIRIETGTLYLSRDSRIVADGGRQINAFISGDEGLWNDDNGYAGGGSGGSIKITLSTLSSQDVPYITADSGFRNVNGTTTQKYSGNDGTVKLVNFSYDSSASQYNGEISASGYAVRSEDRISATSNNGPYSIAGIGGGGRIFIQKLQSSTVTIDKTLTAVNRPSTGSANFNPYAPQKGDIIEVNLVPKNFTSTINTLEDSYLSTYSGVECTLITSGTYGINPTYTDYSLSPTSITFKNIPTSYNGKTIKYRCQVQ